MNKAIYLCAAAALAMASCSNDELVEVAKNDAINFRTVVGLNTKATEVKTADLTTTGVYVTTFDAAGNLLFGETHYTHNGTDWTANQYWGKNASLDFYLTLPALNDWVTGASLSATNKTLTGVTVKDEIQDQVDLVAVAKKNVTKTSSAIDVQLEHVLSQIEIRAKNTNENYKYKIKGVRINNVVKKGNINLETLAWTPSAEKADLKSYEVTYPGHEISVLSSDVKPKTLTVKATDTSAEDNAMLIPTTTATTAWVKTDVSADGVTAVDGTYISVLVNITTKDNVAVYPKGSTTTAETYGWVAIPVSFEWTRGNKYIYTLDFSKGAGFVDPVDPDDKPADTVKPGTDDPDKGKPVLGEEIKFKVTVVEWAKGNGVDGADVPMTAN